MSDKTETKVKPPEQKAAPQVSPRVAEIERRATERWRIDRPAYLVLLAFAVLVLWFLLQFLGESDVSETEPEPAGPQLQDWSQVFNAPVQELADGKVQVHYDFAVDDPEATGRQISRQFRDWGYDDASVFIGTGAVANYARSLVLMERPVNAGADTTLRQERGGARDPQLQIRIGTDTDYEEFALSTIGTLRLVVCREGKRSTLAQGHLGRRVPLEATVRLGLESDGERVVASVDRKTVLEASLGEDVRQERAWSSVMLRAVDAVAVFDNVTLLGAPDDEFIQARLSRWQMIHGDKPAP